MPPKSSSASSRDPLWADVCAPEQTVQIRIPALCSPQLEVNNSPIDDFYDYVTLLIPIGSVQHLTANNALGRALLLGLVSATELYFRHVLSGVINVCPTSRSHASRQNLSLGAVDYYRRDLGLGLLENVSIASEGEIKKQTLRLTGIDLHNGTSVDQAIREFEKLCELRHAAIHARGDLGHQNVRDLGIDSHGKRFVLHVSLEGLHDAAAVCQNLVRAYNRFLFRRTIERWIAEGVFRASWARDRKKFSALFRLFRSATDKIGPDSAYRAYVRLRPTLSKAMERAAVQAATTRPTEQ